MDLIEKVIIIYFNIENIEYINERFINKIHNRENINTNEVIKINVEGDGICLMRCISLFIYKNENKHELIRR